MRSTRTLLLFVLAFLLLAGNAHASQTATLHVTFSPNRLGQSTNVSFSMHIAATGDRLPSPLISLDMRYPSELGLAVSGLGLDSCPQVTLEVLGVESCPPDSRMGHGSALVEIPFQPELIQETARIAIVRASEQEGHIGLLFYAEGETPVNAQIALPGLLLPGTSPSYEIVRITIPVIEGFLNGPNVVVTQLSATFGPRGLTYYEPTHGKLLPYRPRGVLIPNRCQGRGFPFSAIFTFLDGTHTTAHTTVPCPPPARKAEGVRLSV